jgi:fluoride ion exporter CrcB/FEX
MPRAAARKRTRPDEATDVPPYDERVGPLAYEDRASGPPLAAVLAAAIGTFVLGLFVTLAEASASLKEWLNFRDPVGPLSGKTTMAVAAWAVAWLVFGLLWRKREIDSRVVIIVSAVLIGLGLLGTFPAFFESFAAE